MQPENVLYKSGAEDAEPVLADFGLASMRGHVDTHSGLIGTPCYMAPEIITHRRYTEAADVWALGVLLYILLCGYQPFYSDKNDGNRELYQTISMGLFYFHTVSCTVQQQAHQSH